MTDQSSRVLIVDDMPINRMILSSLLATNGIASDQAEGGEECIALCRKKDYDLIMLDHRMPDLDGVDTLVRLKELFSEREKEIPVICHTTEEGRSNINLYKAAGFADVLIKPIDPTLLSHILMTYLPEEEEEKEEAGDLSDELDRLPLWLKTVPHIDLVAGIANCGSAEDYLDALRIFHSSIGDKTIELEKLLPAEDWNAIALRVHSQKSMARLIGARDLGDAAAALEAAARESDTAFVKGNLNSYIKDYRKFTDLLSLLNEDSEPAPIRQKKEPRETKAAPEADHSRDVLFIHTNEGIVTKGIEKQLSDRSFSVISIPDEPDLIITHRFEADIIIYYPGPSEHPHVGLTMNLLGEICQDDTKILCLTGDPMDIEEALTANGSHRVSRSYPRPVNPQIFLQDMELFAELEKEYHRKKTIFVVDDDPDFLTVIAGWLSPFYQVSCFGSGDEVLSGLSAAKPDLILVDYEMPKMNGFELMKNIRTTKRTRKIPIIFLTGKNERDHVFRILEYKPDGYLLKTSHREALLDAIRRFFGETLFRQSL